ncbi:MAG: hypothetical protein ACR2NX_03005 [Chthoniobacterales bacterium]
MKKLPLFLLVLAWFFLPGAKASDLPEFRPALMGPYRNSLINEINTKRLVAKGQKDAVVCFTCAVLSGGAGADLMVYRGTPGSELLQKELLRHGSTSKFTPGVFEHEKVVVNFIATAVFIVRGGQPHLRIYMNQQEDDLNKGADFVAPQIAFPLKSKPVRPLWPAGAPTKSGAVALLNLDVDSRGKLTGVSVTYEHPEGKGFGAAAVKAFRTYNLIPGFRDGKPVTCRSTFPVLFITGRKTRFE